MEQNSRELLKMIKRFKQYKGKKEGLLRRSDADSDAYHSARGWVTALAYGIQELESLYNSTGRKGRL
jgi:hypothetical protein